MKTKNIFNNMRLSSVIQTKLGRKNLGNAKCMPPSSFASLWMTLVGTVMLFSACADRYTPEMEQPKLTDDWVLSRSTESTIESMSMHGRHIEGNGKDFDKKINFDANDKGSWEDGCPTWNDGAVFDLIAFYPATTALPDTIDAECEYQMQYWPQQGKLNRPTNFKLKHLLGQLVVHVTVEELQEEHHEPLDVELMLCQRAVLNFSNQKAIAVPESAEWKEVSGFKREEVNQDGTAVQSGGTGQHKWVMQEAVYVIPQTIPAGILGAKFWVKDTEYGDAHYEFFPPTGIELKAGKMNHVYLGVVYKHEAGEEGDETPQPTVTVVDFSVKVTDWEQNDDIVEVEI